MGAPAQFRQLQTFHAASPTFRAAAEAALEEEP
jgi:hypothetical protein